MCCNELKSGKLGSLFRFMSNEVRELKFLSNCFQINSVKFNEQAAALVSGGYDRSVRAWDCRSNRFDPIQVLYTHLGLTFAVMVLCHIRN